MDLTRTLIVGAGVLVLGLGCGWLGARPPNPHKGPRLVPYRFIMIVCGAVLIYLAAHALSLFGLGNAH